MKKLTDIAVGVAAGLLSNAVVWGYASFVQPRLSIPAQVPPSGVLACAIVSGVHPLEGTLRFVVLTTLLTTLALLLTSRWLRPTWRALQSSRTAVFAFIVVMAPLFFRPSQRIGVVAGCLFGGLFLVADGLTENRRKWLKRHAGVWAIPLFASFGWAQTLSAWFCGLGVGKPAWWGCGAAVVSLLVLGGGVAWTRVSRTRRRQASVSQNVIVGISLLWAVAPFTLWPVASATIWLVLFGATFVMLARRWTRRGLRADSVAELVARFVIPLTIVAMCGRHVLGAVSLDEHHEAEQALPGLLLLLGKTPLVDFHFIHSLIVDCLSSAAAFCLWDVSVHGLRMFREFVCAPLRGLLFWLLLSQVFRRPFAAAFWLLLAGAGQFLVPHPREVLWLEPILVVLCLFVYSERSASRGATILAAALAPLAAALSPEVGVPVGAGVFLAFAVGALREPESGGRTVVLLVFGGSAAIIVAALACFDMFVPFVRFMSTRASVMTELNARWTEQSAVHPFLLVRAFAVAAVATSWCRRGLTRADARVLLPGLLTMLVATFGIMADEPERQWRFVGLDLAGLALALRSGRRRYSFAAVALLLVFAGMFVRPTNLMQMLYHPRFRRGSTLGSSIVDRRLGPLELSVRERRRWYRLAERFDADEPYFNLSNYQLDYFLLDKPLPFPFIPLHVGSRPSHQRAVVDALHDAEPRSIVWRSAFHDLYWGVAPYALMFHLIDAHVLPAYAFDGTVGPCQVLRRERCATVRTYNDLLAPAARKPLPYGWAPFILGLEGERGIARLEPLLAGLPVERRWVWAATIRGDGAASLNIAPRGVRGDRPSSVTVEFLLKPGEHRYIIPIWNLAAWASEDPAEWLRFDASVPPTATVLHSGREALR